MEETLKKYAEKIQCDEISPVYPCAEKTGIIINSNDEHVPLTMLNFGRWALAPDVIIEETTGELEMVLIPMEGAYQVSVAGQIFEGERAGGPFNVAPGTSNASAVYIPGGESFQVTGKGEMIWYSAPTSGNTRPVHVAQGAKPNLSRGSLTWRRDVVTLIEPGKESTNLVVGETFSPPGLWSGTPLHIHDKDDVEHGQSDHEEIYYHVMRLNATKGRNAPYTVQLLFDGETIDKAYIVRDKYAFAIPGASHPVVASPVSDSLYGWALAGKEGALGMWDIPEFAYLKKVGEFLDELEQQRRGTAIPQQLFEQFCDTHHLDAVARAVCLSNLLERGFTVGAS